MKLYVTGHPGAAGALKEKPNKFDVIVYTNSSYPLPPIIKKKAKSLIHFSVDDIDREREGHVAPSAYNVKNFIEWSQDKKEIMCVCHAGVSRSSATAYLIACHRSNPETALKVLVPKRHYPNRLIVWLGSIVLGDPQIWETFTNWQLESTGLDPEYGFHFPEVEY